MSDRGAGLKLEIDLGALGQNWRKVAALAAPAECAAVVKADAYGIGIEHAVPALWRAGCRTFFVALPEEGRRARAAAPEAAIYVLGGFFADALRLYREAELRPVLNHREELRAWAQSGEGRPSALHVDTGMNRLGLSVAEAISIAGSPLIGQAGVDLLMSHLACADEPHHAKNAEQLERFPQVRRHFPALPASLSNSAGTLLGPDYRFDMVRPGIALYGAACGPGAASETVVTAKARMLQVRDAAAGETVGYGGSQTLRRASRLAVLAAGYADGYPRAASSGDACGGAEVVIQGHRVPLVGRVSMDLVVADVTDIPEAVHGGEWAELFGPNMPIEEVAAAAGTIPYALLTGLSRRAERIYSSPGDG